MWSIDEQATVMNDVRVFRFSFAYLVEREIENHHFVCVLSSVGLHLSPGKVGTQRSIYGVHI